MNPFILELARQALRWLGVWLLTIGLPADIAALTEHPEAVAAVAGLVSYGIAEAGWVIAKWRGRT